MCELSQGTLLLDIVAENQAETISYPYIHCPIINDCTATSISRDLVAASPLSQMPTVTKATKCQEIYEIS